jgi:hypothetical protein
MTMLMTVTVTSGRREEPSRLPVPGGPSMASPHDLAMMSRYAQTVADHMSWFA